MDVIGSGTWSCQGSDACVVPVGTCRIVAHPRTSELLEPVMLPPVALRTHVRDRQLGAAHCTTTSGVETSMTRTTWSPAAPSAVSSRTSLVTRSLAVAEPHLRGVVEQQAELRTVGGDVDRLHPTAHRTGETLDQLGSRAVPDGCVLAGLAIHRVGTGDQHVGDRLTGDHVEHTPVAVDDAELPVGARVRRQRRPARGSRSSHRAESRCAPEPGRPTGSPPVRARRPACRPPARACRRGRRRRPGGGRGRCTRCPRRVTWSASIANNDEPNTANPAPTTASTNTARKTHLRRRRLSARRTEMRRSRRRGSMRRRRRRLSSGDSVTTTSSSMNTTGRSPDVSGPPRSPSTYTASGGNSSSAIAITWGGGATASTPGSPVSSPSGRSRRSRHRRRALAATSAATHRRDPPLRTTRRHVRRLFRGRLPEDLVDVAIDLGIGAVLLGDAGSRRSRTLGAVRRARPCPGWSRPRRRGRPRRAHRTSGAVRRRCVIGARASRRRTPARSSKPTSRTSLRMTNPVAAATRSRTASMTARTSAAAPPSLAWMKLACFSDTHAVPIRKPRRPRLSISPPAVTSPGTGFTNTDPQFCPPG